MNTVISLINNLDDVTRLAVMDSGLGATLAAFGFKVWEDGSIAVGDAANVGQIVIMAIIAIVRVTISIV